MGNLPLAVWTATAWPIPFSLHVHLWSMWCGDNWGVEWTTKIRNWVSTTRKHLHLFSLRFSKKCTLNILIVTDKLVRQLYIFCKSWVNSHLNLRPYTERIIAFLCLFLCSCKNTIFNESNKDIHQTTDCHAAEASLSLKSLLWMGFRLHWQSLR